MQVGLPWLLVGSALLGALAWHFDWTRSNLAALAIVGTWALANWWFLEPYVLLAFFATLGFV
jgi:hypothetical protein